MSSILDTYARKNISFKKGEGSFLYTENGDKYLDWVAGIATNILGHCHPHVVKAIQDQSKKLIHVSNAFIIKEAESLAKRLTDNTFADKVFFCNSGTESVEGSIKIVRKYFHTIGKPKKNRIISFSGAFHGRTLAALFLANNKSHTEGFGPKVEGFDQVPFGDHEALKKAINKNTAAIICEPIQGEGGVKVVPDYCLKGLREICDEHEILLVFDCVQTVFRTGTLLGFENSGISPHICCVAKGLGNGLPIGAILLTKEVSKGMLHGSHGSTFGNNPLVCAAAHAVFDIILAKGFFEEIEVKGEYFDKELKKLKNSFPKIIEEVRGINFIKGLKLKVDNNDFMSKLMKYKLLVVKASENCIRLFPSLLSTTKELDMGLKIIKKVCEEYKKS